MSRRHGGPWPPRRPPQPCRRRRNTKAAAAAASAPGGLQGPRPRERLGRAPVSPSSPSRLRRSCEFPESWSPRRRSRGRAASGPSCGRRVRRGRCRAPPPRTPPATRRRSRRSPAERRRTWWKSPLRWRRRAPDRPPPESRPVRGRAAGGGRTSPLGSRVPGWCRPPDAWSFAHSGMALAIRTPYWTGQFRWIACARIQDHPCMTPGMRRPSRRQSCGPASASARRLKGDCE